MWWCACGNMDVDMEEQVARFNLFAKVNKEMWRRAWCIARMHEGGVYVVRVLMAGGADDRMWRYDWGVVHTWYGATLVVEHVWSKCGCDGGVHDALHIPMLLIASACVLGDGTQITRWNMMTLWCCRELCRVKRRCDDVHVAIWM